MHHIRAEMIKRFEKSVSLLNDAIVFGFFFDFKNSSLSDSQHSFNFIFNSESIELKLSASNRELISTVQEEMDNIQYLLKDWLALTGSKSALAKL
jgi:hypothetical protein